MNSQEIIIYKTKDGKASVALFSLSSDYDATDKATQMFFAEAQNND